MTRAAAADAARRALRAGAETARAARESDGLTDTERRAAGLAAACGGTASLVRASAVAGGDVATRALNRTLTAEHADAVIHAAARDASAAADDVRVHAYVHALLEVVAGAATPHRALAGIVQLVAALGPAVAVALQADAAPGVAYRREDLGDAPLEVAVADTDALLLVRPAPGATARCLAFAEEAAPLVRRMLELRGRRTGSEVAKLEAAQRRLRRLALDLHDGPAQDIAALAADAALLEAELDPAAAGAHELAREIRARLATLSREIRDLAAVLEPRSMLREPLADVVAREAARFARRTGVVPVVEVEDDLGAMTASQQIALVRITQGALANVREHAHATAVHVAARATPRGVSLVIVDDGRGFDVEQAARDAAARESLGLGGMRERVALLGGTLAVDSRPGGPTRVEATIPRWAPSATN